MYCLENFEIGKGKCVKLRAREQPVLQIFNFDCTRGLTLNYLHIITISKVSSLLIFTIMTNISVIPTSFSPLSKPHSRKLVGGRHL